MGLMITELRLASLQGLLDSFIILITNSNSNPNKKLGRIQKLWGIFLDRKRNFIPVDFKGKFCSVSMRLSWVARVSFSIYFLCFFITGGSSGPTLK